MFESVRVVGRGRVGAADERLRERQVSAHGDGADLVLLCVPDSAIRECAAAVSPGPWIAHVSGATSLRALDPHVRRFGLHPLQTIDNGFELTGPIARRDWATVQAHLAEIAGRAPELEEMYRVLATVTVG
jgi:predicted short-subunit dehydrogenase-like oxidoreductase (DUF2520 family)